MWLVCSNPILSSRLADGELKDSIRGLAVISPTASRLPIKPSPPDGCPMFALLRTWVEQDGEAPPFSFPVSRCRPVVKALEKGRLQPMYAKREHGAPVQGARLGGKPGKRGRNER